MKNFLLRIFTWWSGQTVGTSFQLWRKGELVGSDEFGNKYYRLGTTGRRWVAYAGPAEPSLIPPGWHAWMHYRVDEVPASYQPREWQKPHIPNLTGTPAAYRPPGSILSADPRTPGKPDYEAWQP